MSLVEVPSAWIKSSTVHVLTVGKVLSTTMCQTLVLQDPLSYLWNVTATDDGLLITNKGAKSFPRVNPYFNAASGGFGDGHWGDVGWGDGSGTGLFQLNVDTDGLLYTDVKSILPSGQIANLKIPVLSAQAFVYSISVQSDGTLTTTYDPSATVFDSVPMPYDVLMSIYGTGDTLICSTCNNAVVDARADLGLWCCACQAFVLPEDTNLLVILDE